MFDLLTPHLSVDWNGIEELKNFDEKAKEHLKIYHRAGIFLWVIHVLMLKVYDNSEAIRYHNFQAVCSRLILIPDTNAIFLYLHV